MEVPSLQAIVSSSGGQASTCLLVSTAVQSELSGGGNSDDGCKLPSIPGGLPRMPGL